MALVLDFCAVIKGNCSALSVTDNTGVYDASTNTTGWGAPNLAAADLESATITINSSQEEDVLSSIPDPVTGEFTFPDIELDSYSDGLMTITYSVTSTEGTTYSTTKQIYFTCSVRCCIDKMWRTIAESCDCNCDLEQMIEDALLAEGLLRALKSAASCVSTTNRDKLLVKIQRLCAFNNCNCD